MRWQNWAAGALLTTAMTWIPSPALAEGRQYGWWSQSQLAGAGTATPPDVPADGLLIQSSPSGPLALSAVAIPTGSAVTAASLTLTVTGRAVLSMPPQVCPVLGVFTPVAGGSWPDRPAYDCSRGRPGVLTADGASVTFDLLSFVRRGDAAVAVLAGGALDRAAFLAPLVTAQSAAADEPTPNVVTPTTPADKAPVVPPALDTSELTVGVYPEALVDVPPTPAPAPDAAPPALAAPAQTFASSVAAGTTSTQSRRRDVGTVLGMTLLVLLVVYWSDAFGAFPSRPRPQPTRARLPSTVS